MPTENAFVNAPSCPVLAITRARPKMSQGCEIVETSIGNEAWRRRTIRPLREPQRHVVVSNCLTREVLGTMMVDPETPGAAVRTSSKASSGAPVQRPAQRDHGSGQLGDVVPEVDERGHVLLSISWRPHKAMSSCI